MTEEERLHAAYTAILAIMDLYKVCYAWDGYDDAEMWLEIDDEPPQKPTLRVVG